MTGPELAKMLQKRKKRGKKPPKILRKGKKASSFLAARSFTGNGDFRNRKKSPKKETRLVKTNS